MKTLVLVRHGKSSWKDKDLKDIDRPLKKRGVNDATLMGSVLKEHQLTPDLIISSPAARAMETAKLLANEYNIDQSQIVSEPKLYLESKSKLLKEVQRLDDRYNIVFMVSHNPGITDLANNLSGEEVDNVPTSGAFAIQFEINSWQDADKGKGKKSFFEVPKTHRKKVEKSEKPVLQP